MVLSQCKTSKCQQPISAFCSAAPNGNQKSFSCAPLIKVYKRNSASTIDITNRCFNKGNPLSDTEYYLYIADILACSLTKAVTEAPIPTLTPVYRTFKSETKAAVAERLSALQNDFANDRETNRQQANQSAIGLHRFLSLTATRPHILHTNFAFFTRALYSLGLLI